MKRYFVLLSLLLFIFYPVLSQNKYEGEAKEDGTPHGKGIMQWGDSLRFEGNFKEGIPFGSGKIVCNQKDNSYTYVGEILGNKNSDGLVEIVINGKGVSVWENGCKYEGNFTNGKRNGKGIFIWNNGETYEGDFVNGRQQGKGKYIWSKGDSYEGDFVNGRQHGKGKYVWSYGDSYEGDFVDDIRVGRGKYIWANGDEYEGDFANGKRHGKGIIRWKRGGSYEGDFVDGKRTGKGKLISKNGDCYEGDFVDGKKHGKGVIIKANGQKIEATFKNDNMEKEQSDSILPTTAASAGDLQKNSDSETIQKDSIYTKNIQIRKLDNESNKSGSIATNSNSDNPVLVEKKTDTSFTPSKIENSCIVYVVYSNNEKVSNTFVYLETIDTDNNITNRIFNTDENGFVTLKWANNQKTFTISVKKEKTLVKYENGGEFILRLKQ